jgi:hypothetical protein
MYFAGTFYFAVSCTLIVRGSFLFPSQNESPINSNLFGVNDVLGPIMQIPYNSSLLQAIARSLRLGGMRFPGGTVANYWNLTSGRYVRGCNASCCVTYEGRVDKLPPGTFTLRNFLLGMGRDIQTTVPLVDLNCLTLNETEALAQLDLLDVCETHECLIELSNELYLNNDDYTSRYPTTAQYLNFIEPVVKDIRARYPKAKISVPASNVPTVLSQAKGNMPEGRTGTWLADLAKRRDLFDAITVHDYALRDNYFNDLPKEVWPTLMAAFPDGVYRNITKSLKSAFGEDIEIWISEYNLGLKSSNTSYIRQMRGGGMHGLFTISHILSAINNSHNLRVMFYHALLSVNGTIWDSDSGMVRLDSLESHNASVNGVSQLFAHVNAVALNSSTMSAVEESDGGKIPNTGIPFMSNLTCLQSAVFFSDRNIDHNGHITYVVINRCGRSIATSFDAKSSLGVDRLATLVSYMCSAEDTGDWVPMPDRSAQFPWPRPVPSDISKKTVVPTDSNVTFTLPMFSLNIMAVTW